MESAFLLGVVATGADQSDQDRPATFATVHHRFSQHPSNHRAAAPTAAGAGADSCAFADLLESLGACLDRFDYGAFADLVAQASGFEILDDRLLSGFLF